MSMGIEIVVASVTALLGLSSLLKSIIGAIGSRKRKNSISIKFESGQRIELPSDIDPEDLKKLLDKFKKTDSINLGASIVGTEPKQGDENEGGFVTSEFLMYFVPGVIAIAFAGTFIYLIISHQDTAGYSIPKELSSAMATILGYFFGVGVSNAANKGKQLSPEDIQKLIGNQDT